MAVEKFFSFRPDWHQDDRAHPLVRQYQTTLDSVLKSHPELQGCVAHCAHCEIRFLTHPRNAGRRDLRCPFGCREHHRRQRSNQRSTAYYQTAAGKWKKKRLNGTRPCRRSCSTDCEQQKKLIPEENPPGDGSSDTHLSDAHLTDAYRTDTYRTDAHRTDAHRTDAYRTDAHRTEQGVEDELPHDLSVKVELPLEGVVLDEACLGNSPMLPYVRMVVCLIEGIELSHDRMVALLRQAMRQHSIAHRRRTEYVLRFLHQHPP